MKILFHIGLILAPFFIYVFGSPLYRDGNVLRHSGCSGCDKASLDRASPYGGRGGEVNRAATVKTKPCHPNPCGTHGQCHEVNNIAACSCLPGYIGTPPTCRPVCVVSKECPENKACRNQICIDPCVGSCGVGAVCNVLNHIPYCSCPSGFSGDPFIGCYLKSPVTKPCHLPLCGQNSQCREVANKAVCSCLPGYRGTPPTCTANLVISNVYPRKDACTTQKCIDPCHGVCGAGARCEVVNYRPTCVCPQGSTGDPFSRCYHQTEAKTLKIDPPVTSPRGPDYANYKQNDEQSKRNCFSKLSSSSPIMTGGRPILDESLRLWCLSNRDCIPDLACINRMCKDPCLGSCGENAVCKVVSHHAICACDIGYHGNALIECRLIKNLEISKGTSPCTPSPCGSNTICKERNGAVSCTCMPFHIGNPLESCRPIEKRVINGTDSQVGGNDNKSERGNDSKRLYGLGRRLGNVSSRSEKYSGSGIEDNTEMTSRRFRNETSRQFGKLNSKSENVKVEADVRATSSKDNNDGVATDLESMKSGSEIIESKAGKGSFGKSKGVWIDKKNEAIGNISKEFGYVMKSLGGESLGGESLGELVGTIEEFESAKTKTEENKKGVGGLEKKTFVQSEEASNGFKNASHKDKVNFNFASGSGNKTLVESEKASNELKNASHEDKVNSNFTSGSGNKTIVESENASNEFKNASHKDKVNFNFISGSGNKTLVKSEKASNEFVTSSHKDKPTFNSTSGLGNKTLLESEKTSYKFKNASHKDKLNFNFTSGSGNETLVKSEKASNEFVTSSHKDKPKFNATSGLGNKTLLESEKASYKFKNASHKDKLNFNFTSGSGNKTQVESEKASNEFKNASHKDKVNFNFTSGSGNKTLVESEKASNEFKNGSHKDKVNFNFTSGSGNKTLVESEKASSKFKNASHKHKLNFNFSSGSENKTLVKSEKARNEFVTPSHKDKVKFNSTSRLENKTLLESEKASYEFKNASHKDKVNFNFTSGSGNNTVAKLENAKNESKNSIRAGEIGINSTSGSINKIIESKNSSRIDEVNTNSTSRLENKLPTEPKKTGYDFKNSGNTQKVNIDASSESENKTFVESKKSNNEFKYSRRADKLNNNATRVSRNATFSTSEKNMNEFRTFSQIDEINPNATSESGNKILVKSKKSSDKFPNSSSIDDVNIDSSSGSGNKTNEFKHLSSVEEVDTSRFIIDNKLNLGVYNVSKNKNEEDIDIGEIKRGVKVNGDSVNVIGKSSGEIVKGEDRSRGGFATEIGVEYSLPEYNIDRKEAVKHNYLSGSGSDKNVESKNATIKSVEEEVGFRINRAAHIDEDASSESATNESTNSEPANSESASSESGSSESESDSSRELEEREFGNSAKRKIGTQTVD